MEDIKKYFEQKKIIFDVISSDKKILKNILKASEILIKSLKKKKKFYYVVMEAVLQILNI